MAKRIFIDATPNEKVQVDVSAIPHWQLCRLGRAVMEDMLANPKLEAVMQAYERDTGKCPYVGMPVGWRPEVAK